MCSHSFNVKERSECGVEDNTLDYQSRDHASPVFRMRLQFEVPSSFDLVVGWDFNPEFFHSFNSLTTKKQTSAFKKIFSLSNITLTIQRQVAKQCTSR